MTSSLKLVKSLTKMFDKDGKPITVNHKGGFKFDPSALQIPQPFRMQISGTTGAGKTTFLGKMIQFRKHLFSKEFDRIIWCHPETSVSDESRQQMRLFKTFFPGLQEYIGLPDYKRLGLLSTRGPVLLVMDDLADEAFESKEVASLFQRISRHSQVSLIIATQNT